MLHLFIFLCITVGSKADDDSLKPVVRNGRDSYLDAYSQSKGEKIVIPGDRQYFESSGYSSVGGYPASQYGTISAGPPTGPISGPPSGPSSGGYYGPPSNPAPVYGSPVPVYGPPSHTYGPPLSTFYGMPHAMLGILDKIKYKLDLFTIGKIILKLVIFKKIVSLIAILCLLLFIPSLKQHKEPAMSAEEEDGMMRSLKSPSGYSSSISSAEFILDAISNLRNKAKEQLKCEGSNCKNKKISSKKNKKHQIKNR